MRVAITKSECASTADNGRKFVDTDNLDPLCGVKTVFGAFTDCTITLTVIDNKNGQITTITNSKLSLEDDPGA